MSRDEAHLLTGRLDGLARRMSGESRSSSGLDLLGELDQRERRGGRSSGLFKKLQASAQKATAMYGLTTATAYLDHLVPRHEQAVQRVVPTTALAEPISSPAPKSSSQQADHASASFTHFPSSPDCAGFINARIINDGRTLELRWLSLVQLAAPADNEGGQGPFNHLDTYTSIVPTQLHFPDPIIATPSLHTSPEDGTLTVTLVTGRANVYRLQFPAPELFCLPEDVSLPDGWALDFEVQDLIGRTPLLSHPLDADSLLVACADGSMNLLQWVRVAGLDETFGWRNTSLTPATGGWWPRFLSTPALGSTTTSDAAGNLLHASADAAIAAASTLAEGDGIGDNAWVFTLGRDRKLRIWSTATFACVGTRDLIQPGASAAETALVPFNEVVASGRKAQSTPLLPAIPRSLLRYVPADEGDDSNYEGFLVVFISSALAPVFVTYGVAATRDRRSVDLVLLDERDCSTFWGDDSIDQGQLRDFRVTKIDPASSSPADDEHLFWTLWTVWNEPSGSSAIRYVPLTETRAWQSAASPELPGWSTILPRVKEGDAWEPSYFDDVLADDSRTVPETFLEYLLRPGRYPPSTLRAALDAYSEPLYHSPNRPASLDQSYNSLEERIAGVVGSSVRLETSPQTGAPLYEAFRKRLHGEWLRFAAMCEESRRSAVWPIELAVDQSRQLVLVFGRACVSTPVAKETSIIVTEGGEAADAFYPALGTMDEAADVARVAAVAASLREGLPREALHGLDSDLIDLVRSPIAVSYDDLAASVTGGYLVSALEGAREALSVDDSLASVVDLEATLRRMWSVVSSTELLRRPEDEAVESASVLAQALINDALLDIIDTRFRLVRNIIVLLLALPHPEEMDAPSLLCAFLATFHALWVLRWISRQRSVATDEARAAAFYAADDSILADQLGDLHMGDQTAAEKAASSSAFSLLTSLMATKFPPGYATGSTPDLAMTYAAGSVIEAIGSLAQKNQVGTGPADVALVQQLLHMGLPGVALQVVEMYPPIAGMRYLEGKGLLLTGRIEDAEDAFRQAAAALYDHADEGAHLIQVLPFDCASTVPAYFEHVSAIFSLAGADLAVARFADAALLAASVEEDETEEGSLSRRAVDELWLKMFRAYNGLGMWEDAFRSMVRMPADDLKHTALQQLVHSMCEAGEVDHLLRLPFGNLQGKLRDAISWRARNSDPRTSPNYYNILYVYHTTRGDYRSGKSLPGTAMYQLARKLAALPYSGEGAIGLWTQQCYSYLSAINALSLVPPAEAWVPTTVYADVTAADDAVERKRRRITYYMPRSKLSSATHDVEVVTLEDVRKEYAEVMARLELVGALPYLANAGPAGLDGDSAVPLFLSKGRVDDAFDKALVLGVDMTAIFASLAESCARVARDDVHAAAADQEWIHQSRDAATWEGSLGAKGWRLLQLHLQRHDGAATHWRYHEAVAEAVLATDRNVKLPPWLVTVFMDKRPESLLSLFFRFDLLDDAFAVALMIISKAERQLPTELKPVSHSDETWVPFSLFDQLLCLGPDQVDLSGPRLAELQATLRSALDARYQVVNKADVTLRRQLAAR